MLTSLGIKQQFMNKQINNAGMVFNSIFTLSPDLSRFKSTNNKSQLYHTDIHVQVLIAFND